MASYTPPPGFVDEPVRPAVPAPLLPTSTTGVTNTEPVALAGAIQGVLIALLAVLVGFGVVSLTDAQIGLILGLYTAVVVAVQAFARGKVWSPASVAKLTQRRP